MNKPILAAGAGVAFGLFLGMLYFGNLYTPSPYLRELVAPTVAPSPAPPAPPQVEPPTPCEEPVTVEVQIAHIMTQDPLSDAQTAFIDGDYAEAIALARPVRSSSPMRAWRITGSAACHLHDGKLADEAFHRLKDVASRQYLVYVCAHAGMHRTGRHFTLDEEVE